MLFKRKSGFGFGQRQFLLIAWTIESNDWENDWISETEIRGFWIRDWG